MPDPMDDIATQARQGSVAAIIQILNEKLADSGLRTRAVFADGVLQLLCEAPSPEQLEQSVVVPQIQQILERISPRNIHRVKINSRIVREQQLLWLEEINRDPENHLLWTEIIKLKQPNFFKRLSEDINRPKTVQPKSAFGKPSQSLREKREFWRGIVGGIGASLLLVLVAWVAYDYWLRDTLFAGTQPETPQPTQAPTQTPTPTAALASPSPSPEPFAEAVRLAEQAAAAGRTAQSSAEWLDIASQWQRASDLMAQVSPEHSRYEIARERVDMYQENSTRAQNEARK